MSPLVSIITVNYNNQPGLARTIDSVLEQGAGPVEFIVIDGGSTDGSVALLRDHAPRLAYWVSEPDAGIYDAMNKGVARATGRYCMFLNSGDCLNAPTVIGRLLEALAATPVPDILYGNVELVNGPPSGSGAAWVYPERVTLPYLKKFTLNHQASLVRTALFAEFGPYPQQYALAADYWLFLTSLLANKHYQYINLFMVNYDASGVSATDNYRAYVAEMAVVWQETVPHWAQELVEENLALADAASARLVKGAIFVNRMLRKMLKP